MPNWKKVITSGSNGELNTLKLSSVSNAGTDTDKFLVLDGTGNVDFRTGAQVLSDIGGQSNSPGTVSSSAQISGYNKFLEFTGDNVISSSVQVNANSITNFDSNVKDKMNADGVISSSAQLTSTFDTRYLNTTGDGVISSSAQVTISSTTGYTTFSSSIASDIAGLNGAGYVDTSGTPANNQIAIFTDSNTIEGDSNLTWNGSTLNVNGAVHPSNYSVDLGMGSTSYLTIGGTYSGVHFHGGASSNGLISVAGTAGQPYGGAGLEINNAANANDNAFIRLAASSSGAVGAGAYWSFGINASDNSHDFIFTNYSTLTGASPAFTISKATNQVKIGSLVVSGSGTFKNIGPAQFSGSIGIRTSDQVAATSDTDKFVVIDGQQLKYRTGAQVLSDIGGQASSNAVTTNTTQTISGVKTFSANLKATSNAEFTGSVKLNTQTAATTDTDKFLVFDTGGQIKYRTGAQVLSDIGGQASGNYVDLSSTQTVGGAKTFTSNATFNGNVVVGGTITAQQFNTELVSASIVYQSGSTKFGNSSDDNHDFTGSIRVDGGITIWNTGDPQLSFTGQGLSNSFTLGIDDSDSDKFKISRSTSLGTNDVYKYNYNGGNQNHTFAGDVVLTNSNVGLTGGQLVKINSSGFLVPAVANTDYVPTGSTPDIYVISPIQTYVDFKGLTQGGLPWGGTTDLMPIDRWMGVWIAPAAGYIDKIIVSPENANATTDQLSIQMYNNASTQGSAVSQLMGSPGTNVSYTFGSTSYSFSGGDRIYLDLNKNTNSCDFYAVQVVFRLNN